MRTNQAEQVASADAGRILASRASTALQRPALLSFIVRRTDNGPRFSVDAWGIARGIRCQLCQGKGEDSYGRQND